MTGTEVPMAFGSARRRGGRLPADVTSFVGRTAELAYVADLLTRTRLVTLVGPGGVGKTRLALRAAARAAERYEDGVCLVELSGLKDAELLPQAVTEALGLPEQTSRPAIDTLVEHVAERELLLILDTCEHVLDACALLTDLLLPEAPRLTILATSRQPLNAPGEHLLPVPPLPLPRPEDTQESEALILLAQRAGAVVPGFTLTEANRDQAAALCRRLDGIPLAIELAAVRLRVLPLGQLVTQLSDTFELLARGCLTTMPRHRTLHTTIDWSHELCTPPERLLWARLSVFAGSFDLAAVTAVAADAELSPDSVLEHLVGLVEKSIVMRVGEGSGRYRLLDTLREYGAARLRALGESEALRRAHVVHYGAQLRHFGEHFTSTRQLPLYQALATERRNLTAALEYALDDGQGQALGLTAVMWTYWVCAGRPAEAVHWMAKALRRHPEPVPERVMTLAWYSMFLGNQGDQAAALVFAREAVGVAADLRDDGPLGWAVLAEANARYHQEEHEAGLARAREALGLLRRAGDLSGQRMASMHVSIAHLLFGQAGEALEAAATTLELMGEGSEECYVQGSQRSTQGLAHMMLGSPVEAAHSLRIAVRLKGALRDTLGVAAAVDLLAWLAVGEGQTRRAAWLFGAAATQWRRIGQQPMLGNGQMLAFHERYERLARESLGTKRYAALYAKGAALSPDEVVLLAAEERGAPRGAPRQRTLAAGAGQRPDVLTRREREVAELVAEGLSNRGIAERLVIAKRTADVHVERILAKLGCSSRTQVAALFDGESGEGESRADAAGDAAGDGERAARNGSA